MRLRVSLVLLALPALATIAACSDDTTGASSGSSGTSSSGAAGSSGSSSGAGNSGAGSSGASGGETSSGGAGTSDAELCVATINKHRADLGLPAYARWAANESCTDGQAASDGKTKKAHGAFGTCGESAQNECPGWPAPAAAMIPDCLAMMMDEGPGGGHYDTMTSTRYTQVSCGFATSSDGKIWAVQNFK